jgi:hypothetical protein
MLGGAKSKYANTGIFELNSKNSKLLPLEQFLELKKSDALVGRV